MTALPSLLAAGTLRVLLGMMLTMLVVIVLESRATLAAPVSLQHWVTEAAEYESWIIRQQEHLHTIPELLFDTPKTYAHITSVLTELGIAHRRPESGIGVVASIGSGEPTVVLRSDIDALPLVELGTSKVKSSHKGVSHMCGHDGHMAMLLGGARMLHDHRHALKGTVTIVFQPAEEGGAGGDKMVQEGVLDGASAAFGLHVMPHIPTGVVASRAGTIMAGASTLHIVIKGVGGHAALPQHSRDPVVAAAAVTLALQSLVSRETDPLGSSVISITQVDAGTTHNVIPDYVTLTGTVRALDDSWMARLHKRIEEVATYQALSYGCEAEVDWRRASFPYYPPTVNDPTMHSFAVDVAQRLFGANRTEADIPPVMAAEDFSFFTRKVPSAFVFLGIRNEELGSVHGLHNTKFLLDQAALKTGAAMHAAVASEWLKTLGSSGSSLETRSDEL